ncbi:hypothetical protein TWF694_000066 [Orbilia ellipsospora]|uniref:Uncharacterized protein n=1 Tax=Orbilia ellipsospora TaxID=2528407 RepID=A0AAV9XP35_9PEZI
MFVWVFTAMSCGTIMIHKHTSRQEKREKIQLLELREKNRLKELGIKPPDTPPEDIAAAMKRQKKIWKRVKNWTTKPKVDNEDEHSEDGLPRNFRIPRTPIPWDNFREPPVQMGREAEELDTVQPMTQERRQTISSFARRPTIKTKHLLGVDPKNIHEKYRTLRPDHFDSLNHLGVADEQFTPWGKEGEEPHMSVLTRMLRVSEAMAEGRDFRYGEETADQRNTPRTVKVPFNDVNWGDRPARVYARPKFGETHPWDDFDEDLQSTTGIWDHRPSLYNYHTRKVPLLLKPLSTDLERVPALRGPAGLPLPIPEARDPIGSIGDEDEPISPRTVVSGVAERSGPGMRGNTVGEPQQGTTASTARENLELEVEPPIETLRSTSSTGTAQPSRENKPPHRGRK